MNRKLFLLALLGLVMSGCTTMQTKRCEALREEFSDAPAPCVQCQERLSPYGDAATCAYVCSHAGAVSPVMQAACTAAAPSAPAPAAPAATPAPTEDASASAGEQ